jgi:tRNA(Ile)-lysidine synthase
VLQRRDRVALSRLREIEPAVARLVVQRLADDAAGGVAPGVARRAAEILALGEHGTVQLDAGGGVVAIAEYGVLRFESQDSRPAAAPTPVLLRIPGTAVFGDREITCELGAPARQPGVVDRAALGDELLVRSWRPGDRMAPLGLQGSKSLQDLFTARRVPRRERAGVPVVESEGEIVWVAGVATSERFKVTDSTDQAVHLSVRPQAAPRP